MLPYHARCTVPESCWQKGKYSPLSFGTIREILLPVTSMGTSLGSNTRITVQLFKIEPVMHSALRMPVVVRTDELVVVLPEVLTRVYLWAATLTYIPGR